MAKIIYWNRDKGFGFCNENGQEFFVHFSSIFPHPRKGRDLKGEKIQIFSTEEHTGKKPSVTLAGWGEPSLEKAQLKVVGEELFMKWEGFSDYVVVPAQPDEIPTIEEGSIWEIKYWDGLVVPVKKIMSRVEHEESSLHEKYVEIKKAYFSWIKNAQERCREHEKKSTLAMQDLDFSHLWPWVLVDDIWVDADICHVTKTVYAKAQFVTSKVEYDRTSTCRGEIVSWGVGTFTGTIQEMVSPERAFLMPEELEMAATTFNCVVIKELSYLPSKYGLYKVVAIGGGGVVIAVWDPVRFVWNSPHGNFEKKFDVGARWPVEAGLGKSYFYQVYMAREQGLDLDVGLIPWMIVE